MSSSRKLRKGGVSTTQDPGCRVRWFTFFFQISKRPNLCFDPTWLVKAMKVPEWVLGFAHRHVACRVCGYVDVLAGYMRQLVKTTYYIPPRQGWKLDALIFKTTRPSDGCLALPMRAKDTSTRQARSALSAGENAARSTVLGWHDASISACRTWYLLRCLEFLKVEHLDPHRKCTISCYTWQNIPQLVGSIGAPSSR